MTKDKILSELMVLYEKFMNSGDINRASEIMIKISEIQLKNEARFDGPFDPSNQNNKNILLG